MPSSLAEAACRVVIKSNLFALEVLLLTLADLNQLLSKHALKVQAFALATRPDKVFLRIQVLLVFYLEAVRVTHSGAILEMLLLTSVELVYKMLKAKGSFDLLSCFYERFYRLAQESASLGYLPRWLRRHRLRLFITFLFL